MCENFKTVDKYIEQNFLSNNKICDKGDKRREGGEGDVEIVGNCIIRAPCQLDTYM